MLTLTFNYCDCITHCNPVSWPPPSSGNVITQNGKQLALKLNGTLAERNRTKRSLDDDEVEDEEILELARIIKETGVPPQKILSSSCFTNLLKKVISREIEHLTEALNLLFYFLTTFKLTAKPVTEQVQSDFAQSNQPDLSTDSQQGPKRLFSSALDSEDEEEDTDHHRFSNQRAMNPDSSPNEQLSSELDRSSDWSTVEERVIIGDDDLNDSELEHSEEPERFSSSVKNQLRNAIKGNQRRGPDSPALSLSGTYDADDERSLPESPALSTSSGSSRFDSTSFQRRLNDEFEGVNFDLSSDSSSEQSSVRTEDLDEMQREVKALGALDSNESDSDKGKLKNDIAANVLTETVDF